MSNATLRTLLACAALLALSFMAAPRASAQPTTSLSGQVVEVGGAPLFGASVVLRDVGSPAVRYGAATDADGRFSLSNILPGAYRFEVRFLGYATHEETLRLGSEALARTVTLDPTALPSDDVVVTAQRAEAQRSPITFSNLTERDLERLPAMKDVPVLLATTPSVTRYSENGNGMGYSYLRLRGFGQRRIAVSINGIPQNDPEEFDVFWINVFDLQNAASDIQVQRGVSSAQYGPTGIGGAIDIAARPVRPESYVQAEVGYGAYETRKVALELNTGLREIGGARYGAFVRGSRMLSDGYRDHSWSEFWRFFASATRLTENSTLTLQAFGGPQHDGLAYIGIPKAANDQSIDDGFGGQIDRRYNYSAFTDDIERFHQPHAELLHTWTPSPDWTLDQAVFWIGSFGYFDFDGTFRSADYLRLPAGTVAAGSEGDPLFVSRPDVTALLFRANLSQQQIGYLPRVTRRHAYGETTVGLEARLHCSNRWGRIQDATGFSDEVAASNVGGDADARVYDFRNEKRITSAFVTHRARPHELLEVQADVQATYRRYRTYDDDFFGIGFTKAFAFVNPRIGVTVAPERPFSGYASLALAHREPRMKALYDGEESPAAGFLPQFERRANGEFDYDAPLVDQERVVNLEIGASLTQERYRLRAVAYGYWFRDEIVASGELDQFGVPRTGNADRTRHLGIELEAGARLARGLDVEGHATLSRNRFVRFTEFLDTDFDGVAEAFDRADNPIPGFPEASGYLGVAYARSGFTARLGATLAGEQYVDNSGAHLPDGSRSDDLVVDAYALIDAGLRYDFGARSALRGLSLALDVNNVLDDEVLLFGNAGFGAAQFFPAATRHAFVSATYRL